MTKYTAFGGFQKPGSGIARLTLDLPWRGSISTPEAGSSSTTISARPYQVTGVESRQLPGVLAAHRGTAVKRAHSS